ncbi:MAG: hypothetical protein ACXW3K_07950 [Brevundimonas sp.]
MRRTVLALAAIALVIGGCQQPAATTPAGEPAAADAAPPEMPADAPPQEEVPASSPAAGEPGSCLAEVGADAATRLVQRCIAVSPATHPPCNSANPCAMIQGEIDRACEMYAPGEAKPPECAA